MSKVQLNQKEQHYADTREQAEEIVSAAKENDNLQMHKITEKYNKYGQYFLIDLTYAYQTPKEVMENPQKDNAPEGQMSTDDLEEQHEGVEYTIDKDGSASVAPGKQELVEDGSPF
ncbi:MULTISPECIES: organic solvent tolerance protein OstA [unclassified Bacillus (in: firmicutes)]|uniref:organic solvent tolerance protein OstA n=1 Tax=unclassified Bacillus (in: firmicutes) TaxID=185979 RepID=UPI001BECAA57|nr:MULTISPECIES: organic solvent tolerance protein OstA [unclassified Bacillus (in: firmicutes)]MBT2615312.1 organic solvent tolerance protein OstA [Bacillus sp. ISL-78]MBT2628074.1 organic solvent tolerance protein OstA [Bacillus sp. ISL-101]